MTGYVLVLVAFSMALVSSTAASAQTLDANASVVHLRKSCSDVSSHEWCFTSTAALTDWIWRNGPSDRTNPPSATDRVLVLAGPGDFDKFVCNGISTPTGWVTVIGAGREHTRFVANSGDVHESSGYCAGGITVDACEALNFQDLTAYGSHNGVMWGGGGLANWSDVDMVAGGPESAVTWCGTNGTATLGWYDVGPGVSKHYFFGCRAIGNGNPGGSWTIKGLDATSSNMWFYGGEILAEPTTGSGHTLSEAVLASGSSWVRVFGSTVRAKVGTDTGSNTILRGAFAGPNAEFHMHGGIVNVDASGSTANVTAEGVKGSGFAHLHATAFNVRAAGTGTAKRLVKVSGGNLQAPFTWHPGTTPPAMTSLSGQDLWVDTDADATGRAHLMIYDASCLVLPPAGDGNGEPWRDQVDGTCR
jgi:hypothetical protein